VSPGTALPVLPALPLVGAPAAAPAAAPVLPPLYAGWAQAFLDGLVPDEPASTCGACAMACPSAEAATAHAARFRADAKCCTYLPTLWNFLAGAALRDESPGTEAGRATVERRIDRAIAVTPLGLRMSSTYEMLYRSKLDTFGRNAAFRCPHYVDERGGLCGIWKHRNSVCATYFCKLERGAVSHEFWTRLRQLLGAVEEHLAQWCMLEMGVDPAVLAVLFPTVPGSTQADLDGGPEAGQRQRLWGGWMGREREFYRGCAELVEGLSWSDVLRICGPSVAAHAALAARARSALERREVPERLRMGKVTLMPPEEDGVAYVSTYTPADIPKVPQALLGQLHLFDGTRATPDAVREVQARTGVPVDAGELQRLVDFGILVPADAGETTLRG
jgi:Fe-S-cluster containining protein